VLSVKRTALALTLTPTLLILILAGSMSVDLASANFMPLNVPDHNIEITPDGNVTGTDKIQHNETIYTFTGNISGSIVVLRDNITIDGAGYTLQGNGYPYGIFLEGRKAVSIKNMTITDFDTGVVYSYYREWKADCRDNIVIGNNITNNRVGISCYIPFNITISENAITNNKIGVSSFLALGIVIHANIISGNGAGIQFTDSDNNIVCSNNFINNTSQVALDPGKAEFNWRGSTVNWDNGSLGNFWSDYNGTDVDGDGIGDTPYSIDDSNQDNYPLMTLIKLPTKESTSLSEPFPTTLVIATIASVAFISLGLLVYFKKRKH